MGACYSSRKRIKIPNQCYYLTPTPSSQHRLSHSLERAVPSSFDDDFAYEDVERTSIRENDVNITISSSSIDNSNISSSSSTGVDLQSQNDSQSDKGVYSMSCSDDFDQTNLKSVARQDSLDDLPYMVEVFQTLIEEKIDVMELIPHMTTFIEDNDYFRTKYRDSPRYAASLFIERIIKSKEGGIRRAFIEALKKSGDEHLADLLTGRTEEDLIKYKTLLKLLTPMLMYRIYPPEIIEQLHANDVISQEGKEKIECELKNNGSINATLLLLELVPKKVPNWCEIFVGILKGIGLDDAVVLLEEDNNSELCQDESGDTNEVASTMRKEYSTQFKHDEATFNANIGTIGQVYQNRKYVTNTVPEINQISDATEASRSIYVPALGEEESDGQSIAGDSPYIDIGNFIQDHQNGKEVTSKGDKINQTVDKAEALSTICEPENVVIQCKKDSTNCELDVEILKLEEKKKQLTKHVERLQHRARLKEDIESLKNQILMLEHGKTPDGGAIILNKRLAKTDSETLSSDKEETTKVETLTNMEDEFFRTKQILNQFSKEQKRKARSLNSNQPTTQFQSRMRIPTSIQSPPPYPHFNSTSYSIYTTF